ncbi:hypothetical protein TWF718_009023 [Orbilia javanica]|uniref:Uncharacterized protein n=1 Tax=Orbilia javanica TaxID=47235 RepID=A0AAN8MUB0_9PEZI
MPPINLTFERLCAGTYEANASTIAKYPPQEQALPITMSTYQERQGRRSKARRIIAIDFTNWKNRRCRLTVPARRVMFNLLTENVVYLALHSLERGDKMILYIANENSVEDQFSTYTAINTMAEELELRETPPPMVRLGPVDLWDITKKLIILRGCTSSAEDQLEFFKDIDRDPDEVLIVQKQLNPEKWEWDSDLERETIRKDIRREKSALAKKKKAHSMSGSLQKGEKRVPDSSASSDTNTEQPTKPPKKRPSLGQGTTPTRSQEANRSGTQISPDGGLNHNQTDETSPKTPKRRPRARRGARGGRRGTSEGSVASPLARGAQHRYDSYRHEDTSMDIDVFEDSPETATATGSTNESTLRAPSGDSELPGLENLQVRSRRGTPRRSSLGRGGRGRGSRGRSFNPT